MEWFEFICNQFDFPKAALDSLKENYCLISQNEAAIKEFNRALETYEKDFKSDFSILSDIIKNVAEIAEIQEYIAYTLFLIQLLKPLKKFYQNNGLSEEMWQGVALDIKYKTLECYDVYKIYGTFVMVWFDRFFNLTRFSFGRLQMETVELDGNYVVDGVNLKKGDTVLSVHIPRSKERLDRESVEKSYQFAQEFYKNEFSDYTVFTCKTYLMHPSTVSLLKPNGNLYEFVSKYKIVYSENYENYSELWRLFDCLIDESNLDALPQNTSLRKDFVSYMKSGKKIGYGHRIYVKKNTNLK